MEIKREGNILYVYGNIKSLEDFEIIKAELDSIKKMYDNIIINLIDSISITSSVIGYLNKLVDEGINITIKVKEDLYDLFDELGLVSLFNIRKL